MMEEKNVENMTFEECMKELNRLVASLESGELDLDKSLQLYERAVAVRERCRKILEEADRKVQTIIESANGNKIEDFKEEE